MIHSLKALSPAVRALLDLERSIPAQPELVRARAIVRARAALVIYDLSGQMMLVTPAEPDAPALVKLAQAIGQTPQARSGSDDHADPLARAPTAEVDQMVSKAPAGANPYRLRVDAVSDELRLLRPARAAVASEDYATALFPLREHAHRFQTGRFAEEREALRIKALVGLGQTEEARRAAALFQVRFPQSVLVRPIQMTVSGVLKSRPTKSQQ